MMACTEEEWRFATIDAYKPLENPEGWLRCPNCNEHPRTWVFDNGNHARCRCVYRFERGGASAPSIIEAVQKCQIPYDEYRTLLRKAWNAHVRALLPAGEGK